MPKDMEKNCSTTNRAKAFMIEHLIAKKTGGPASTKVEYPKNEVKRVTVPVTGNGVLGSDRNNNQHQHGRGGSRSNSGSTRSSANTSPIPVMSSNPNYTGYSKAVATSASLQHDVQNSYVPLELTKSTSGSSLSANVTGKQSPSSNSNSVSTSPVDLTHMNSNSNSMYYPFSTQQQQLAAQYYPYYLPIGFQGSGNFGFHTGLFSSPWVNPFLTLPPDSIASSRHSEKVALLLSLHNNRNAPYGVHYEPPRSYSSTLPSLGNKRKGGQIRFSDDETRQLEKTFRVHHYLNSKGREKLALALGLSDRQVKTWFQNRRAKYRKNKEGSPFNNEIPMSRSSIGAADSPDDGRCESATQLKGVDIEHTGYHNRNTSENVNQHKNANHNNTNATSGGKIFIPSELVPPEKLYRGLPSTSSRSLGHIKMISCA